MLCRQPWYTYDKEIDQLGSGGKLTLVQQEEIVFYGPVSNAMILVYIMGRGSLDIG